MTKVLIVDDISENLYLLESLLKGNGYETISATNGSEALNLALQDAPDLIISDILMPVMDGYSLCREWKNDAKLKKVPFVFYTATYTHHKDEEFALNLGADMFLIKPQEPDEFIAKIRKVLKDFDGNKIKVHEKIDSELAIYKEYNQTLIRKMEDRMLKSEESEKKIKSYAEQLEIEIEQRKRAAQALKESEVKYRSIFENSGIAILLTSPDGSIFSANGSACRIFDRTEEEICKAGRAELVDQSDPNLQILLDEREKTGKAKGELTLVKKDGSKFKGEVSSVVFLDSEGKVRTSMVIHDLSEQRKVEEDLKKSQQLFQNFAHVSPVGIFRTNKSGDTTYVNPRWSELSGLPFESAKGTGWLNAIHPDDKEKVINDWNYNFDLNQPSHSEYRFLKPDGAIVWVIGNAVPEKIDNVVIGYIGTITDITERKSNEEAIYNLNSVLEKKFEEKTKELKEKLIELEHFHDATIDRELRIKELRNEIERLKGKKTD